MVSLEFLGGIDVNYWWEHPTDIDFYGKYERWKIGIEIRKNSPGFLRRISNLLGERPLYELFLHCGFGSVWFRFDDSDLKGIKSNLLKGGFRTPEKFIKRYSENLNYRFFGALPYLLNDLPQEIENIYSSLLEKRQGNLEHLNKRTKSISSEEVPNF